MLLEPFDSAPFAHRRRVLGARLGRTQALIPAGWPQPRNYAANTYPFRAGSHFLYLFGEPLRGAFGHWDGHEWTVFAHPPSVADALWEGPSPSLSDLATRLGCPTRTIDDLNQALRARELATVPAMDRRTLEEQSRLLGRTIGPGSASGSAPALSRSGIEEADGILADALIASRLIHDEAAQAQLRLAAQATAAAHRAGMRATRPGVRESVVRAAMEAELIGAGMNCAYGSIVTVHGEVLHNEHHRNWLREGDLLLADVGAETEQGWAGDVTRTWPVTGRFSPSQRDAYEVVLAAQRAAIAAVRPGVRYRDLHALACHKLAEGLVALQLLHGDPAELVADGVVALLFPHGIGHLLGLDVHDMEDLGDRAGYAPGRARASDFGTRYLRLDRDLAPGMALTIEPGLYLVPAILESTDLGRNPRFAGRIDHARLRALDVRGIRIEDDVLVTAAGCEVLTAAIPKDPDAVERAVTENRASFAAAPS